MKKIVFIVSVSLVLLIASCKKSDSNTAGSWAFEGVTYNAANAVFSSSDYSLTANSSSNSNQGSLVFYFPAVPIRNATYKVVNYTSLPLDSNQLYIQFINGITSYYYSSEGSDNVNANVSISPSGKITVTVASVYLKAYSRAVSDSSQLTATLNQQ